MSAISRPIVPAAAGAQQLRAHLHHCRSGAGKGHRMRCIAEMVVAAIAPRLVTTTSVLLLLGAAFVAVV